MTKEETYTSEGKILIRKVALRDGTFIKSIMKGLSVHYKPITSEDYDIAWLKSKEKPIAPEWRDEIRMVDLFSGTGPMTLGIVEAGRQQCSRAQDAGGAWHHSRKSSCCRGCEESGTQVGE